MNTIMRCSGLVWLVLAAAAVPAAEPVPAAIFNDPAPDKAFPPAMVSVAVPSGGATMNGIVYVPSGAGPHPGLVLLHGFPGNERNLDLAQAARRAGWAVLAVHYRGSWGSGGAFSFRHAIEDSAAAVGFLRSDDMAKRARVARDRIVVAGHSMGGFMAAITAARDPAVVGVAMISAWNIGYTVNPGAKGRADRASGLRFMAGGVRQLAGCTAEGLVDEALAHEREWDFVELAPALAGRPLLLVSASGDNNGPQSDALAERLRKSGGGAYVTEHHLETDHSYSDKRIALQTALLRWLERVAVK